MKLQRSHYVLGIILLVLFLLSLANIGVSWVLNKISPQADATPGSDTPFDQSVTDGTLTFSYPSDEMRLALNPYQVLVKPFILPCDEDFDYCLYYIGTEFGGTNFESSGIRIKKRQDLSSEQQCLTMPPVGLDASVVPSSVSPNTLFSASVFHDLNDAATGHYSAGSLYRLFIGQGSLCYEFQTRIGESQFQNYPSGSIREFASGDREKVQSLLRNILDNVSLSSGQKDLFFGL